MAQNPVPYRRPHDCARLVDGLRMGGPEQQRALTRLAPPVAVNANACPLFATPSRADIEMTRAIVEVVRPLGIGCTTTSSSATTATRA
jgi:hypothetical protein